MPRCARFRRGPSSKSQARPGGKHAAHPGKARSPPAGVDEFPNSLWVGVLDWDLRRAGGFSYRVYRFAKD